VLVMLKQAMLILAYVIPDVLVMLKQTMLILAYVIPDVLVMLNILAVVTTDVLVIQKCNLHDMEGYA